MDRGSAGQPDIDGTPSPESDPASERLHLAPPPRHLPPSLRLLVLLGTPVGCMAWLVLGFGTFFFWLFTASADFTGPLFMLGTKTSQGVVYSIEDTGHRPGGVRFGVGSGGSDDSLDDGKPILAHRYGFAAAGGKAYHGTGYMEDRGLRIGGKATIEYVSWMPSISRIRGMRAAPAPMWVGIVALIFPWLGIHLVARETSRGRKSLRLMRIGKLAFGVRKSKRAYYDKEDGQHAYRYRFEFEAEDGRMYRIKAKAVNPGVLEDQKLEPLLYDPADPTCAMMLDTPERPVIDEDGNLHAPRNAWIALAILVGVPLVVILGNAYYIYCRFF